MWCGNYTGTPLNSSSRLVKVEWSDEQGYHGDDKDVRGILKLCPNVDGRDKASFQEYRAKVLVIPPPLSLFGRRNPVAAATTRIHHNLL